MELLTKMANLKGNNTQYANTSGPGSSSSCSISSLETVKNVAKELALDVIVDFARLESSSSPRNKHVQTLKRTMREISQRHEILFCSIIRRLEIVDRSEVCSRFTRVVNELLVDGQLNWGRIVTIYAFAGWLARHCSENGMPDSVQEISECAGTYVADKLSDWILQQGGWDAFDEQFSEEVNIESQLWKGLLYTFLGLGALATIMALKN